MIIISKNARRFHKKEMLESNKYHLHKLKSYCLWIEFRTARVLNITNSTRGVKLHKECVEITNFFIITHFYMACS